MEKWLNGLFKHTTNVYNCCKIAVTCCFRCTWCACLKGFLYIKLSRNCSQWVILGVLCQFQFSSICFIGMNVTETILPRHQAIKRLKRKRKRYYQWHQEKSSGVLPKGTVSWMLLRLFISSLGINHPKLGSYESGQTHVEAPHPYCFDCFPQTTRGLLLTFCVGQLWHALLHLYFPLCHFRHRGDQNMKLYTDWDGCTD